MPRAFKSGARIRATCIPPYIIQIILSSHDSLPAVHSALHLSGHGPTIYDISSLPYHHVVDTANTGGRNIMVCWWGPSAASRRVQTFWHTRISVRHARAPQHAFAAALCRAGAGVAGNMPISPLDSRPACLSVCRGGQGECSLNCYKHLWQAVAALAVSETALYRLLTIVICTSPAVIAHTGDYHRISIRTCRATRGRHRPTGVPSTKPSPFSIALARLPLSSRYLPLPHLAVGWRPPPSMCLNPILCRAT